MNRMKTNCWINLIAATFGFAAVSAVGSAENEKIAQAVLRPSMAVTNIMIAAAEPAPIPAIPAAAMASSDGAAAQWSDIKDCTYDMRVQFFAGLKQLESKVDGQISELAAKRAAMKSTTDTKAWDFAIKEMGDARSYLKSMGEELSVAPRETWDQEKDKVGQAWLRTQEAYDRVKSSTTS